MAYPQTEFTEEWLIEAIGLVSFCIVEDGAVYAPILERLERELEILRTKQDVVSRARQHLATRQHRLMETPHSARI